MTLSPTSSRGSSSGSGLTTYRKVTSKAVGGTVAATDLLNGEITIAAAAMGISSTATLTARGDWKQNSGGTADLPRWQVIFGGVTVIDTGVPGVAVANVATRRTWRAQVEIFNLGAANSQWVTLWVWMGAVVTAGMNVGVVTTGEGLYGCVMGTATAGDYANAEAGNASAVDTTASAALALTVINASANANYDVTLKNALVVIV